MKNIFVAITFMFVAYKANACSICGCGGGNLYLGIFPNFNTKFVGVRYNYSNYKTVLKNDNTQFSKSTYNNIELWAGFNLSKKWQVFAFVPYQYNEQISDDGSSKTSGLGDITVLTNYQLINKSHIVNDKKKISHQLWIGGGIKINSGSFDVDPQDSRTTLADINAQIGTGSTDFLLNIRDVYEVERLVFASNISYKINTKNTQGYQFGNKLMLNSIAFYNFNYKYTGITPNLGLQIESNEGNKLNGNLVSLNEGIDSGTYHTGGYSINFLGGLEVSLKKVSLGVNMQVPLRQNYAAGQTNLNWKGMGHITFSF